MAKNKADRSNGGEDVAVVPDVPVVVIAGAQPSGPVMVQLLDRDGRVTAISAFEKASDRPFRLVYEKQSYEHVSDDEDGTWQYAPR